MARRRAARAALHSTRDFRPRDAPRSGRPRGRRRRTPSRAVRARPRVCPPHRPDRGADRPHPISNHPADDGHDRRCGHVARQPARSRQRWACRHDGDQLCRRPLDRRRGARIAARSRGVRDVVRRPRRSPAHASLSLHRYPAGWTEAAAPRLRRRDHSPERGRAGRSPIRWIRCARQSGPS